MNAAMNAAIRVHRVGPSDVDLLHRSPALFDEPLRDEWIERFVTYRKAGATIEERSYLLEWRL